MSGSGDGWIGHFGWKLERRTRLDVRGHIASARRANIAIRRALAAPREGALVASPEIHDQGATSSCVGYATAGAIHDTMRARGVSLFGFPSARLLYRGAQLLEAGGNPLRMRDDGIRISSIDAAVETWGCGVSIREWDPPLIFTEPPATLLLRSQRVRFSLTAIYASGTKLVQRIVDSLALGQGVVLTLSVDAQWSGWQGPHVIGPPRGEILGGHAVRAVAWRTVAGVLEIRIANSWSERWRGHGCAWLTAECVGRAHGAWYCDRVEIQE